MNFHTTIDTLIQTTDFVANLLGEQPQTLTPLTGGHISAVYRAQLHNGTSYVLKFAQNTDELRLEQHFLAAWSAHGVHTPQVLQYAPLPDGVSGGVLKMAFMEGQNLLPLVNDGAVDVDSVMVDLGTILATMHQVTASRFGTATVTADGTISGSERTFRDGLWTQEWADAVDANLRSGDLLDSELRLVDAACAMLSAHGHDTDGVLIHDDFRAGNVLYDAAQAQPYTVIDPHPKLSHPYLCLAYALILPLVYGNDSHPPFIQRGYNTISPLDDEALHAARFLKALELLPRWGQPGHPTSTALHAVFREEKAWMRGR